MEMQYNGNTASSQPSIFSDMTPLTSDEEVIENAAPQVNDIRARFAQFRVANTPTQSSKFFPPSDEPPPDLAKELLVVYLGQETEHIKYNSATTCYEIVEYAPVSSWTRGLVDELGELGWLYNKITHFCHMNSQVDEAITMQSFRFTIHECLTNYYLFLSQLKENYNAGNLRFLQFFMASLTEIKRMKWLAVLWDAVHETKGGKLISTVHSYATWGDAEGQKLIQQILDEIFQPIKNMIKHWMLEGELIDPKNEFFIKINYDVEQDDDQHWQQRFYIDHDMVPSFLDVVAVKKILITGKSVNFIRKSCGDENWGLVLNTDGELVGWIDTAYAETNQHVLDLLINKYKLIDHFDAIRRYLLLGQGDFHQSLIENMAETLSRPAKDLYRLLLLPILETAISTSNARLDSPDILNRLNVDLYEVEGNDSGWEVFALQYDVYAPLSTIFTADVLTSYGRMFNLLWRIRRISYTLGYTSLAGSRTLMAVGRVSRYGNQLHRCQLIQHEMSHFLQNIMNYMMIEAVEAPWKTFISQIRSVSDLDHLNTFHAELLENILKRSLLIDNEDLFLQLISLFEKIVRFKYLQEVFYEYAIEDFNISRGIYDNEILQNASNIIPSNQFIRPEDAESAIKSIEILARSYQDELQTFIAKLGQSQSTLKFKLNFNEYYVKRDEPIN